MLRWSNSWLVAYKLIFSLLCTIVKCRGLPRLQADGGGRATVGRTRGWGGVNLIFLYFEVNFLACIIEYHFSVNVSPWV